MTNVSLGLGDDDETAPTEGDAAPAIPTVRTAVRWTTTGAVIFRLGTFLSGVLAARLIAPADFGAFAVALTVYLITIAFSDMGVSQAIAREVNRTSAIAPTANTILVGTTSLMTLALIAGAGGLAAALQTPSATDAIRVLSLTMVVGSLGTIPAMILTRDYRQKERFFVDLVNFAIATILLFWLALDGWGPLALAFSRLGGQAVASLLFNLINKERHGFGWNGTEARHLLRFSLPLAGASVLTMIVTNIDSLVIARALEPEQLGYYNLAFSIANWPVGILSTVFQQVTIPTFARAEGRPVELSEHLRSALGLLSAVALPTGALLCALSGHVVVDIYGENWAPAGPVLALLALMTVPRLLHFLLGDLLIATGHTRQVFLAQLAWVLLLTPAMIILVQHLGIEGAAAAHCLVGGVIITPLFAHLTRRQCHVTGWFGTSMVRPLMASIATGLVAFGVTYYVKNDWADLLLGGLIGALTYLLLAGRWARTHLRGLNSRY